MSNDPKTDLMYAILALDSYNRGYGAGINKLEEVGSKAKIGTFSIVQNISQAGWEAKGFYALAYRNSSGETIISYRGTDANFVNPFGSEGSDLVNGYGLALGIYREPQPDLALRFYKAVAGFDDGANPFTANVSTTGHSLGGGLAGYVRGFMVDQASFSTICRLSLARPLPMPRRSFRVRHIAIFTERTSGRHQPTMA